MNQLVYTFFFLITFLPIKYKIVNITCLLIPFHWLNQTFILFLLLFYSTRIWQYDTWWLFFRLFSSFKCCFTLYIFSLLALLKTFVVKSVLLLYLLHTRVKSCSVPLYLFFFFFFQKKIKEKHWLVRYTESWSTDERIN